MIASVVATLLVGLLAMAPGLALLRGRVTAPGQIAAASCVSLVLVLLATALAGMVWGALTGGAIPAWSVIPVALTALAICIALMRERLRLPSSIEWEGCALALAMIGFGLIVHAVAVRSTDDGALLVHAWYNADWFKHMGHVAALRNGGIPAGDIFNAMEPLHYYWLSYLLPAAGSALGGDNYAALTTAQAIIVGLLCMTLYGTLRATTSDRRTALLGGILAFLLCAEMRTWSQIWKFGVNVILNGPPAPGAPALLAATQYIPQHALTVVMLLSWFLLDKPNGSPPKLVRVAALASLAAAMTVSTLLGAAVLSVYGLLQLWRHGARALVEVGGMAIASGLLVIALGVIKIGNPSSAIESPLLINDPSASSLATAMLIKLLVSINVLGLPFVLAFTIFILSRSAPRELAENDGRRFAIILLAVGLLAPSITEGLLSPRLAFEMGLRAPNLSAIGIAVVLSGAFSKAWSKGRKQRLQAGAAMALMIFLAMPSIVLWTVWFGNHGDRYTTRIPGDDRKVLALLSQRAAADALVWQYPEAPFLADPPGRDAWVATIAGRAVTGSLRATEYIKAKPRIAAARAFYQGKSGARIDREVEWIYLSRTLHPQTFEPLVDRMQSQQGWSQVVCYTDACLFQRERSERPQDSKPKPASPRVVVTRARTARTASSAEGARVPASSRNVVSRMPMPPGATGTTNDTIHAIMKAPAICGAEASERTSTANQCTHSASPAKAQS